MVYIVCNHNEDIGTPSPLTGDALNVSHALSVYSTEADAKRAAKEYVEGRRLHLMLPPAAITYRESLHDHSRLYAREGYILIEWSGNAARGGLVRKELFWIEAQYIDETA